MPKSPLYFDGKRTAWKGLKNFGGGMTILAAIAAFAQTPEGVSVIQTLVPGAGAATVLTILRMLLNIYKTKDKPGNPLY